MNNLTIGWLEAGIL